MSPGANAGLTESYKVFVCFSICKALQSLIFGYFQEKTYYEVLFLVEMRLQT